MCQKLGNLKMPRTGSELKEKLKPDYTDNDFKNIYGSLQSKIKLWANNNSKKYPSFEMGKYSYNKTKKYNAQTIGQLNSNEIKAMIGNDSGIKYHKGYDFDFYLNNYNLNGYIYIGEYDLKDAYMAKLFTNQFPSTQDKSELTVMLNDDVVFRVLINTAGLPALGKAVGPIGKYDAKKKVCNIFWNINIICFSIYICWYIF